MSVVEIMIIIVFSAAGAVAQGSLGIGLGLIAGPALIAIDPGFAPGPLLLAGVVINARHIVAERDHIDRAALRRCLVGLPVGLVAGLALLTVFDDRTLAIFIGGLTAAAAIALLIGWQVARTPRVEVGTGAAVALASVTAGLPGPPFVVSFSDMSPGALRGTSGSYIMVVAVTGLIGMLVTGEYGRDELGLTLTMIPGVMLGLVAARWVRPLVDRPWFRTLVLVIALAGAVALVARQLI